MDETWIAIQAWSSGLERGLGLGADVVNGLGGILGAVHGGTGNEHVGTLSLIHISEPTRRS